MWINGWCVVCGEGRHFIFLNSSTLVEGKDKQTRNRVRGDDQCDKSTR